MKLDVISHLLEEKQGLTLNIMVGIPGSGKSFYINNNKSKDDIVISPDLIRKEITGDISNQSMNNRVFEIAYERLNKSNKNTWFDATNVSNQSIEKIIDKGSQFSNINIIITKDSYDSTLCKKRIHNDIIIGKDRSVVPPAVVDKMHNKFLHFSMKLDDFQKELHGKYKEKSIIIKSV